MLQKQPWPPNDLSAAQEALNLANTVRYATGIENTAQQRHQLQEQIASKQAAAQNAANAAWLTQQDAFIDALIGKDIATAEQILKTLKADSANKGSAENIAEAETVLKTLQDQDQFILKHLTAQIGKPVSIQTDQGTKAGKLLSVNENWLKVEMTDTIGGKEHTFGAPIRWQNIRQSQLDTWLAAWQVEGEAGAIAQAIVALRNATTDGADAAVQALANGGSGHQFAPAITERIRALKVGAAEVAAEKAYAQDIAKWEKSPIK